MDLIPRFDLWGTCITRDIFALGTRNESKYNIETFIQNCSFIPAFGIHAGPTMTLEYFQDLKNRKSLFDYKCFMHDFNKTTLATLKDSEANWLIIDFTVFSYGLVAFQYEGGSEEYITFASWEMRKEVLDRMDVPKYRIVSPVDLNYMKYMDQLVEFCIERYGNNIILIETPYAYDYIDHDGNINIRTPSLNQVSKHYDVMLNFIKKTDCHYVKCPFNIIADQHHRWGLSQLHYITEYYEYAIEAINVILKGADDETRLLDYLFLTTCQKLTDIRVGKWMSTNNTIRRIEYCIKEKKVKEGLELANILINQNVPDGYILMSQFYMDGMGVDKDIPRAIEILRDANSKFDDIKVKLSLYKALMKYDLEDCKNEALQLIETCAYSGDGESNGLLARCYRDGKLTPTDKNKSIQHMKIAVEKGVKWARYELFDLMWTDNKTNDNDLVELVYQYAIIGDYKACGCLGRCY